MNNKTKRRIKGLSAIILLTALILLLLGVIGFIAKFTSGFNTGLKTFYLVYDGETIFTERSGLILRSDRQYRFDVGYTFSFADQSISGYSVEILPNAGEETDFIYTINGNEYLFSEVDDLKSAFGITQEKGYFTIRSPGDMQEVLSRRYPFDEVRLGTEQKGGEYFILRVYDKDKAHGVDVYFGVEQGVTGIGLDTEEVVF